ncbi:MAG: alpha-1,2-fucosyltransferase [Prevotella sp.]|nr:alpha-1,2-fucosyltransferase [Prevotella sp.]
MKVIHIESGLGNQMLSYCEYLAMRRANPDDDIYIENIIFDIPECNDVICQWNGYELQRVFGINAPNIREYFTSEQWEQIMSDIRASEFWLRNWNYPVHFTNAFRNAGLDIKNKNLLGDFERGGTWMTYTRNRKKNWLDYLRESDRFKSFYNVCKYTKMIIKHTIEKHKVQKIDNRSRMFISSDETLFAGQTLLMKQKGSGIELIEKEVREAFRFPQIEDERNAGCLRLIAGCNSVAIHARRGDMVGGNYNCYHFGYFRRAVTFLRRNVTDPVFFVFCDPGSVQWAKDNETILGLDFKKDTIHFVDWNKGADSFRDMQLMAACKHQVITNSSFGWWGAWLNTFPGKITCSPSPLINTTHTF